MSINVVIMISTNLNLAETKLLLGLFCFWGLKKYVIQVEKDAVLSLTQIDSSLML